MSRHHRRRPDKPTSGLDQPFPERQKTLGTIKSRSDDGFSGRYRKGRFHWLAEEEDAVRKRNLYCWLFLGRRQVGAVEIFEFQPNPFIHDDDFCIIMDADSHTTMELAEILVSHWDDPVDTVACFGNIVMINALWVSPRDAKRGEWSAVVLDLLATVYRRRSLLVLKAFPMDDRQDEDEAAAERWRLRQRALIRHYCRLLGMKPFPGSWGREGWLYAIPDRLLDFLDPPMVQPPREMDAAADDDDDDDGGDIEL